MKDLINSFKENIVILFLLTVSSICLIFILYNMYALPEFANLKLNEKGDFIAGILSPLGFMWLIYGYIQQGQELKLNTEALQIQAEELKNTVFEQRRLIEIHLQDNFSKHFSIEPRLKFKGKSLEIKTIRIPMHEDTEDYYIDEYTYADVTFTIENIGGDLKDLTVMFKNSGNILNKIYEIKTGQQVEIIFSLSESETYQLKTDDFPNINTYLILKYYDKLGKELVSKICCECSGNLLSEDYDVIVYEDI
ncbi:hypothetical protein [Acinetobacter baumannii]|uniref:hypothetical protein n=1 Tax=Acinetobacter baumannii TaxID=470 RepID=UPI000A339763|nr:hypothetical protein [Acinetobacter baumannii]OTK47445.1 hypothetical protein B9X70_16070 [Acinetobacter baumannii]OTM34985.1 hypothetical protein B9X47_09020 [Acinetobacter baumannii]